MAIVANLRKMLHRKTAEYCLPLLLATTAGSFVDGDMDGIIPGHDAVYAVLGASNIYEYNADDDSWLQLANSGVAGVFGSGSCGEFQALSAPAGSTSIAASAGTTTTFTTALTLVRDLKGCQLRCIAGTGSGYLGSILHNTLGANAVVTVAVASGVAFSATSVFQIAGGSLWFFSSGGVAVGLGVYDRATNTWTQRSVVGLPTAWSTDGQLVGMSSHVSGVGLTFSLEGQATAGAATTLTTNKTFTLNQYGTDNQLRITAGTGIGQARVIASNTAGANSILTVATAWTTIPDATSTYIIERVGFTLGLASAGAASAITTGKVFLLNQWANMQIRILGGPGAGQIRTIASNTAGAASVITVSAAWTTIPDATSTYVIEGNDDLLFLLGNNAVTMYRYSISANTWTTLAPVTARAAAIGNGGTAEYIDGVEAPEWLSGLYENHYLTTVIHQNGRYVYSFRGAASNALDVYDIAANTWINGVAYGNQNEVLPVGSCSIDLRGQIYIQLGATGRIVRFDVAKNILEPWTVSPVTQGGAITGDRMFMQPFKEGNQEIDYLYSLQHTGVSLTRWLIV